MTRLTDKAPRSRRVVHPAKNKGLVIVYTGSGKGKTIAALGTALRALGWGWNVAMVQFIKGSWKSGELDAAKKFGRRFKIVCFGNGFTWETKSFENDIANAKRGWRKCLELLRDKKYQLVIFDEINLCMQYRFLDSREVIAALKKKQALKHVILTGRGAPQSLIGVADLVTEMKCIKHPYKKGMLAQPGIDY